ncbi:MAG: hypothetical protein GX446_07425 [Chthonomonadales bacterium]|nr:hypothetical protein [Chthonomonadales bacterium]
MSRLHRRVVDYKRPSDPRHGLRLSWAFDPTDYVEVVRRLGPEYVPVTIAEYVRLYGEAGR